MHESASQGPHQKTKQNKTSVNSPLFSLLMVECPFAHPGGWALPTTHLERDFGFYDHEGAFHV